MEWDGPYKMWKLLREYDSDLDSGFTRVYSPNLISGFDRYHRHPDLDALHAHNKNILEFEAMLVGDDVREAGLAIQELDDGTI